MPTEISLDDIYISPAVYFAWEKRAAIALKGLIAAGVRPQDIPDERVTLNDDGTLTIFVEIPNVLDISLDVPADQWAYIKKGGEK